MLTLPVCSGASASGRPQVSVLKVRRPFRLNSLARRHTQTAAVDCRHCCSKAKLKGTQTHCQASGHEDGSSRASALTSSWSLSSSLGHGFEWAAPLVAASLHLPENFGGEGGDSNGAAGGGGGGSGDESSGGSGQGDNSGNDIIAGIAAIPGKNSRPDLALGNDVPDAEAGEQPETATLERDNLEETAPLEHDNLEVAKEKETEGEEKERDPRVPEGWDYFVESVSIDNSDLGLESNKPRLVCCVLLCFYTSLLLCAAQCLL